MRRVGDPRSVWVKSLASGAILFTGVMLSSLFLYVNAGCVPKCAVDADGDGTITLEEAEAYGQNWAPSALDAGTLSDLAGCAPYLSQLQDLFIEAGQIDDSSFIEPAGNSNSTHSQNANGATTNANAQNDNLNSNSSAENQNTNSGAGNENANSGSGNQNSNSSTVQTVKSMTVAVGESVLNYDGQSYFDWNNGYYGGFKVDHGTPVQGRQGQPAWVGPSMYLGVELRGFSRENGFDGPRVLDLTNPTSAEIAFVELRLMEPPGDVVGSPERYAWYRTGYPSYVAGVSGTVEIEELRRAREGEAQNWQNSFRLRLRLRDVTLPQTSSANQPSLPASASIRDAVFDGVFFDNSRQ